MLNADTLPDWEHQRGYLGFIPCTVMQQTVMQKEILTNSAFQSFWNMVFLTQPSRSVRKGGMRKHFPTCARIPAWPLESCGHHSLPEVPPSPVALPQPGGEIRAGYLETQRLKRSQSGASLFE